MVAKHNRWAFSHGRCGCDVCKADYATYKREKYWADGHTPRKGSGELKHGTMRGYNHYKCRCLECYNAMRRKNGRPELTKLPTKKVEVVVPVKEKPAPIRFPTPEERAARRVEWAGIAI
jgi:hypothetical protein